MSLGLQRREPSAASCNRDILGWMSEPGSFGLFPPLPSDPREVISLSGLVVYNMQDSVYTECIVYRICGLLAGYLL